jgi:hypothetical protein
MDERVKRNDVEKFLLGLRQATVDSEKVITDG